MSQNEQLQQTFQTEYDRLNPEQKLAVDAIDGPVMVVAGPGTGKTQILTLRIANILKQTDTDPDSILALTFTEAAAANMQGRLVRFVGAAAHSVRITTFHGFANEVIQSYSEYFPSIIGAQPVTEVEQVQILESILLKGEFELLKPFGDTFYYLRAIRSGIDELKREGVTPEEFSQVVERADKEFAAIPDKIYDSGAHKGKMKGKYRDEEKKLNKNRELATIYAAYQDELRKAKRYDFADMLVEVLRALRSSDDLRLSLQEHYQYILVDEHQDSNNAQNKILEQLLDFHDNPNIFVVGDEKQAIFRFQGASLENFYYFKHRYPAAQLITLRHNYRSTKPILDIAEGLLPGKAALEANTDHDERQIEVYAFGERDAELWFLVSAIKQQISAGVDPAEIAVLYRNNKDALPIADMFDRIGVPYQIESDQDVLSHPVAKRFLTLVRGVANYGYDSDLAKLLHIDVLELDHLDVFKLIRAASQKRKYQLFDVLKSPALRKDLKLADEKSIQELYANLDHWVTVALNENPRDAALVIVRQSGLLQYVVGHERSREYLAVLEKLLGLVAEFMTGSPRANLRDWLGYLDTIETHRLSVSFAHRGKGGAVRLMTAHRSKGLEFDYVYVAHAEAGRFGASRKRELLPLLPAVYRLYDGAPQAVDAETDADDDERRLFYVALTRAKKHIRVSYAETDQEGKTKLPSPFLAELQDGLFIYSDTEPYETKLAEVRPVLLEGAETASAVRLTDQSYIRELFIKNGLSVSALNNYLKSPWRYLYRNLLRIPEAPTKHQAYGIAVHAALQDLFDTPTEEELPGKEWLVERFIEHLDRQVWTSGDEYRESKQKGEEHLAAWYDDQKDTWVRDCKTELRVNAVYLEPDIALNGVFDKVELLSDGTVNVVDYKTGKPKTRNDILGATKSSTGDYYRQLVFYKLLLRYHNNGQYRMKTGEIVFLAPDSRGQFRREKFEISEEEVDELEAEVRRVAHEIMHLDFWSTECDTDTCDYCDLVQAIKKNS